MSQEELQDIALEQPTKDVFIAPSIDEASIHEGHSYTYHSPVPEALSRDKSTPCVLGVDEAGRGPVLGPMVYGMLYLPLSLHHSLLADRHHFDDSKVLTPEVRSNLLRALCTAETDLYESCGWATRVMSARDISAGMLQLSGSANLNAQAMDATIQLIHEVLAKGVNVEEIYIDTIGTPAVYQKKLERIFPVIKITVAKKADSLYPCVSAASVCAKVTRDAALEVAYRAYATEHQTSAVSAVPGWGSGYPSDARAVTWLKANMDPLFGWGCDCRFSWNTAKDMLDSKAQGIQVEWPEPDDQETARVTDFFSANAGDAEKFNELAAWYGTPVGAFH